MLKLAKSCERRQLDPHKLRHPLYAKCVAINIGLVVSAAELPERASLARILRTPETDSVGTATFKRDGEGVTDNVLSDGSTAYTPGVSERRSGATRTYHLDRMVTVRRQSDSTQAVLNSRAYDAFGVLMGSAGTTNTPFGFVGAQGYQEDGDSGLMLLGHRYYDPATGRLLTRDSAKDGWNWYAYCANNPLNWSDPTGKNAAVLLLFFVPGAGEVALISVLVVGTVVAGAVLIDQIVKLNNQSADRENGGKTIEQILKKRKGSIRNVELDRGSPSFDDIKDITWEELQRRAKQNEIGFKTIKKVLTDGRFKK